MLPGVVKPSESCASVDAKTDVKAMEGVRSVVAVLPVLRTPESDARSPAFTVANLEYTGRIGCAGSL